MLVVVRARGMFCETISHEATNIENIRKRPGNSPQPQKELCCYARDTSLKMLEMMSVILPHQDRVSDWRSFYKRYTAT